jgi:hypothetical protein
VDSTRSGGLPCGCCTDWGADEEKRLNILIGHVSLAIDNSRVVILSYATSKALNPQLYHYGIQVAL